MAHSLGGILLEDVLRVSGQGSAPLDEKDIYLSTFATLFLGTPFRGSSAVEWALIADSFVKMIGIGTNSKVLKELKLDTGVLNILSSEFRECVKQRAINVRVFQESKGLSGIKGLNERIVPEYSSKLDDDTIAQPLNYNHMEMCRYATRDDEGYRIVGDEIKYWVGKASEFHGHYGRVSASGLQNSSLGKSHLSSPETVMTSRELFEASEETLRAFLRPATVGDDLDDLLYRRQNQTGLWIFENQALQDWCSGVSTNLWITGKPGSGKSTLAATIIDRLQIDSHMVAYFFCRFQDDTKKSLPSILGTWTWQILKQFPQFTDTVLRHRTKGSGMRSQDSNIKIALEEVLAAAPSRIFFIVDGLDECESVPEVSRKLERFVTTVGRRHSFLVVSRNKNWAAQGFYGDTEYGKQKPFKLISLANSDTASGIEYYLQVCIRSLQLSSELESIALKKLIQRADGMFLWVEFQIKALAEQFLQEDARMVLEQDLPDGLDATYQRMLQSILATPNPSRRAKALRILQWITAATRSLTLDELDFALGIKLDTDHSPQGQTLMRGAQDVTQACGAFVEVTKRKEIRLIHASAREFLTSKGVHVGLGISQPGNPTEDALNATYIARACMTCLSFTDIGYVGGPLSNNSLRLQIQQHIVKHPFLGYASLNWWKHLSDVPSLEQGALASTVARFLGSSGHVVKWLQLYQYYTQIPSQRQSFHPRQEPCWKSISSGWEANLGFNPAGLFNRWERWLIEIWYALGVFWPVVHIAAFFDFQSILEHELEAGVPVNFRDDLEFTPLLQAAHGDSKNAALTLLDHGAELNARTRYGYSAVRYACRNSLDVLPLLLDRGGRLDFVDGDTGKSALHEISQSVLWHPLVFKSIMKSPSALELVNSRSVVTGETPLHLAAAIDATSSATLLQQRYRRALDPRYQRSDAKLGMPTCDLFSAQGSRAVQVLREAWADLGVQTPFRNSADCFLRMVIAWKARLVQDLLHYGADANLADRREHLPLHRAVSSMSSKEESVAASLSESMPVVVLIRNTRDLDHQFKKGRTPLQIAMHRELYSTVRILIQHGAGRRTFTEEELRSINANAAVPHSSASAQTEPWTRSDKHSSIKVLDVISVLRLLSPKLSGDILSRIVDHAKVWTATEYFNMFGWYDRDIKWPANAVLVTEEITGAAPSPVRELSVWARSRDHDWGYHLRTGDLQHVEYYSQSSLDAYMGNSYSQPRSRFSGNSRARHGGSETLGLERNVDLQSEYDYDSVLLQVAVLRKGESTTLEYGPGISSAMSSTVTWSFNPTDNTDEAARSWLKGLRPGDRVVIALRSEAASFDISLLSELRLNIRTSWLSDLKPELDKPRSDV